MSDEQDNLNTQETDIYRNDGALENVLTGMGVRGRDKSLETSVAVPEILDKQSLENLYHNGLVRRYVDEIPDALLSHPPTINLGKDPGVDTTIKDKFDQYLRAMDFSSILCEQIKLQRLYGGGGAVLLINDGQPAEEPVNLNTIRSFNGFVPLSNEELIPADSVGIDYSRPTHYQIYTTRKLEEDQQDRVTMIRVHKSRVARFDGLYLPTDTRQRNNGWGLSCVQVIWEAFVEYNTSISGLGQLMSQGDLLVHSIPGLMMKVANNEEVKLTKRLELNKLALSLYNMFIKDKDEEITNLSRPLNNIAQAMTPFVDYLQATTGWPKSILMGESPGGLGKEGRFEERMWAAIVARWCTSYCTAPVRQIFQYILLSKTGPTRGQMPPSWEVEFPSIYTETPKEETELQTAAATTAQILIDRGVIDPLEARTSFFSGSKFNHNITLIDAITQQLVAKKEATFQTEMMSIAAQQDAMLNPQGLEEPQTGAVTEGEEQQQAEQNTAEEAPPEPDKNTKAKTDSIDICGNNLRIKVTHELPSGVKAGYVIGADNLRVDSSTNAPFIVLGPNRKRNYKMYKVKFVKDSILTDGPVTAAFHTIKAAKQAVQQLYPRYAVAGMIPLRADEVKVIQTGWEDY